MSERIVGVVCCIVFWVFRGSGVFPSIIGVFGIGGVRVDNPLKVVVGIVGKVEVFLQSPLGASAYCFRQSLR